MAEDFLSNYTRLHKALRDAGIPEEHITQLMLKILMDPDFKHEKLELSGLSPEEIATLRDSLSLIDRYDPKNTRYNLVDDIHRRERTSYGSSSSSPISSSSDYRSGGYGGYGGGRGGGGGGCFIATAAYGTPFCEQLYALKTLRDEILSKNVWGRKFMSVYYTLSPPIANHIRHRPVLRGIVRGVLVPFVWLAKRMLERLL